MELAYCIFRVDRSRALRFREFDLIAIHCQRQMCVCGRGQAQCPLQNHLSRRASKQVRAANHVSNLLIGIIDDDSELIRE
jgi:hypothetical protein